MIKFNKHIATVLIGIFFFPLAFQSIHIVWHHDHLHYDCYHVFNSINNSQAATISTTGKINTCPICEYKFSINNLPVISVFRSPIPKINNSINETIMVQLHQQIIERKSPRAPPLSL